MCVWLEYFGCGLRSKPFREEWNITLRGVELRFEIRLCYDMVLHCYCWVQCYVWCCVYMLFIWLPSILYWHRYYRYQAGRWVAVSGLCVGDGLRAQLSDLLLYCLVYSVQLDLVFWIETIFISYWDLCKPFWYFVGFRWLDYCFVIHCLA